MRSVFFASLSRSGLPACLAVTVALAACSTFTAPYDPPPVETAPAATATATAQPKPSAEAPAPTVSAAPVAPTKPDPTLGIKDVQVGKGADPRSVVTFLGRPKTDDDDARLEGIVIMRDFLLDEINDDDDIPELMIVSIIDELRRFFRLEGLEMGTGEE